MPEKNAEKQQHLKKAYELFESRDFDNAFEEFKIVRQLDPNDDSISFNLGVLYA